MSKEQIEKLREDLAKADAGCPPNTYCEYSCASCAADSRLEDDGVKNVRLLLAEIDRLSEALQLALPIVEEAYWDHHTAGTLPGSGYNHKAQSLAGRTWGWRDSSKFMAWLKEVKK